MILSEASSTAAAATTHSSTNLVDRRGPSRHNTIGRPAASQNIMNTCIASQFTRIYLQKEGSIKHKLPRLPVCHARY